MRIILIECREKTEDYLKDIAIKEKENNDLKNKLEELRLEISRTQEDKFRCLEELRKKLEEDKNKLQSRLDEINEENERKKEEIIRKNEEDRIKTEKRYETQIDSLIKDKSNSFELIKEMQQEFKSKNDELNRRRVAVNKGRDGELDIMELLKSGFQDVADVEDKAKKGHMADINLIFYKDTVILVDIKDYESSVPTNQVDKLIRDLDSNSSNLGILISLNSGITKTKERIEIRKINEIKTLILVSCLYKDGYEQAKSYIEIIKNTVVLILECNDRYLKINDKNIYEKYNILFDMTIDSYQAIIKDIIDSRETLKKGNK